MKILVTGGCGFIGTHLSRALEELGHDLVLLDIAKPAAPPTGRATFVQGDLRDEQLVQASMTDCEAVLHLAAAHHDFGIAEETFQSVNVGGAEILVQAMKAHGIRNLCFYSTVAVYGSQPPPLDETVAPAPESAYGRTKWLAEKVFRRWAEAEAAYCLVIRPTVTFGRGHYANVLRLISQIDRGLYAQIGGGDNVKSLSYIDNIVAATVMAWFDPARGPSGVEVYNYADKPDLTSGEIVDAIYQALHRKRRMRPIPYRLARLMVSPLDAVIAVTGWNLPVSGARIHKLARATTKYESQKIRGRGFRQTVSTVDGLRDMVAWYQTEKQRINSGNVRISIPPAEPLVGQATWGAGHAGAAGPPGELTDRWRRG